MNPIFVLIREASGRLEEIGAGNPRLEAEHLMARALGIDRIGLWLRDELPPADAVARFEALLARRLHREPLQYVLGNAIFAGLTLEVGPGVFIPRSETEVLVEQLAARLDRSVPMEICDVCTGSGAILLALLARLPRARGVGIDQSGAALEYARRNALATGLAGRTEWLLGDLLDPAGRRVFDAIVSNPPYIALAEADALAPEIRDFEPADALYAGADGLETIRRLIPQAASRLRPDGWLAVEIGVTQEREMLALLEPVAWRDAAILPDLSGRPRIAMARSR